MRYKDLAIQTLRDAPSQARTPGFAFLVRAGYLTRERQPTALGQFTLDHLASLADKPGQDLWRSLAIQTLTSENERFFPLKTGALEVLHCPSCGYTERRELALVVKKPLPQEPALPLEQVETPACHTIEALATFLELPAARTAKALLFTRHKDGKLVFAIVRGDMQLSQAKLEAQVGEVRPATEAEITNVGAVPGYASPLGLKEALIVVDDLIPRSTNLVAGANQAGYHVKNVNYGRDFSAEIVCDLALANADGPCATCAARLETTSAEILAGAHEIHLLNTLRAVAESHHDERGLIWPLPAAPFMVYLMQVPGRTMDTLAAGENIYKTLREAGISVLFDDREERAGVKFNDADLIGLPVRLTVGERSLADGMVELKLRDAPDGSQQPLDQILPAIQDLLP